MYPSLCPVYRKLFGSSECTSMDNDDPGSSGCDESQTYPVGLGSLHSSSSSFSFGLNGLPGMLPSGPRCRPRILWYSTDSTLTVARPLPLPIGISTISKRISFIFILRNRAQPLFNFFSYIFIIFHLIFIN